jgi:hypothetical protein
MTSLRSICAAAALAALVMGPAQGFAMATNHGAAGVNVVTPAARPSAVTMPLVKLAGPGLFEIEDYSFDLEQTLNIGG